MLEQLIEIKTAFLAQIPIAALEVIAPEEIPTISRIVHVFADKNIYYWSLGTNQLKTCTFTKSGELIFTDNSSYEAVGESFSAILQYIQDTNNDGLYILGDMQKYISEGDGLEDVVSLVKAMYSQLKPTSKKVLFMGQNIRLHNSLLRLVPAFVQSLPSITEIEHHIKTYLQDLIQSQSHLRFELSLADEDYRDLARSALAMSIEELSDFLRQYIAKVKNGNTITIDASPLIQQLLAYKTRILRQLGIELAEPAQNDFGGLQCLREWLVKRRRLFSEEAKRFGLKNPKGAFLVGPPGTGKSLIAKNIASILKMPLLKLELASQLGSLVGESENNVKKALAAASSVSPCILWVDEVDKVLQGQSDSTGVSQRILGLILDWMQEQSGVFVVATANNIEKLPAEFLRKGRFDEIFFVDLPAQNERLDILKIHLGKYNVDIPSEQLELIASETSDFSGAELEAICSEAAISAFEESSGKHCLINISHLQESARNVKPLAQTNSTQINQMREWATNARSASSNKDIPGGKTIRMGTSKIKIPD